MTLHPILQILPLMLAGLGLGAVYFVLLHRTVAVIGTGDGWRAAAGFVILRLAVIGAGMVLAVQQGAGALLALLAGFLLARAAALRLVRRG